MESSIPSISKGRTAENSASETNTSSSSPNMPTVANKIFQNTYMFYKKMETNSNSMQHYKDQALLEYAKSFIPIENLQMKAINRLRSQQRAIREQENIPYEPFVRDLLIIELVNWFRTEFFEWVDTPPCKVCNKTDNSRPFLPYVEDGVLVETYLCCGEITKFYRYNDIRRLLETKKGRCGEFANCFTFLCQSLGYDCRLVTAEFDHVWTEFYSINEMRWIHVDPSENVVDSPLMYQHGWGRQITFVIAYSLDDIQDVTWRYSSNHTETKKAREKLGFRESELISSIIMLRKKRHQDISEARKYFLNMRNSKELVDLLIERRPTENELKGRSSGHFAWKAERGELSTNFYVFEPIEQEIQAKQFNLRYSCCYNSYERYIPNNENSYDILWVKPSWEVCRYSSLHIIRKVERDWRMVYLARAEGAKYGEISWKFDFSKAGLTIKTCSVNCEFTTFANGVVNIKYFVGDIQVPDVTSVIGSSGFKLQVELSLGQGDNAWQHSQLFRQQISSTAYPFEVKIEFE